MYCATCWTDASYCPPQPDGTYLCPGCAGFAAHLDELQVAKRAVALAEVDRLSSEAARESEAKLAEYHRAGKAGELASYIAAPSSPLCNCCGESYDPSNPDGSCGSCGYL